MPIRRRRSVTSSPYSSSEAAVTLSDADKVALPMEREPPLVRAPARVRGRRRSREGRVRH